MSESGIYKIKCLISGMFYIGSAVCLKRREREHFTKLKKNKHFNQHLQHAWNKYGEENFVFEIIEECCVEDLIEREQCWLNETKCYEKNAGYNICKDAKVCDNVKLSKIEVEEILEKYESGLFSYADLAKKFNVTKSGVAFIIQGRSRIDVSERFKEKGMSEKRRNIYKKQMSKKSSGEGNPKSKLTWKQVEEIRVKRRNGKKRLDLAEEYDVSLSTIKSVIYGWTWKTK